MDELLMDYNVWVKFELVLQMSGLFILFFFLCYILRLGIQ